MPSVAMPLDQIARARTGPGPHRRPLASANECAADKPSTTTDQSALSATVMMPTMPMMLRRYAATHGQ